MWQLFRPLTDKQFAQKELERCKIYEKFLLEKHAKIINLIEANQMVIDRIETNLKDMK